MTKSQEKDSTYWAVFDAIIKLDILKGHLKWKVSEVARTSKISRTLIYYYFGNSKESMLKNAVDALGEEYFGLSQIRIHLWKDGQILESVLRSRRLGLKSPYVNFFYMSRRFLENETGKQLRDFEIRYKKKLKKYFPKSSQDDIEALAAVFFGLVAMPDLSDRGVENALHLIKSNLFFKT